MDSRVIYSRGRKMSAHASDSPLPFQPSKLDLEQRGTQKSANLTNVFERKLLLSAKTSRLIVDCRNECTPVRLNSCFYQFMLHGANIQPYSVSDNSRLSGQEPEKSGSLTRYTELIWEDSCVLTPQKSFMTPGL